VKSYISFASAASFDVDAVLVNASIKIQKNTDKQILKM